MLNCIYLWKHNFTYFTCWGSCWYVQLAVAKINTESFPFISHNIVRKIFLVASSTRCHQSIMFGVYKMHGQVWWHKLKVWKKVYKSVYCIYFSIHTDFTIDYKQSPLQSWTDSKIMFVLNYYNSKSLILCYLIIHKEYK